MSFVNEVMRENVFRRSTLDKNGGLLQNFFVAVSPIGVPSQSQNHSVESP